MHITSMHFFISDIHLMSGRKDDLERRDWFLRFLRYTFNNAKSLWIGGDLFDFWYEWKTVIPKVHFEILSEFKKMCDAGFPIHIMPGNHDFALHQFLQSQVGLILHSNPSTIIVDGLRIHWVHGDGVANSDRGYRVLKKVFASKWANFLFRWLHPDIGMKIALSASKSSRYKSENIGLPPDEEYLDYVDQILSSHQFDCVVMGHTHLPKIVQRPNGLYINTGDGIIERSYGVLNNGQWRLERFEYKEQLGPHSTQT
ncbi:MAG: UDP-2,3-diacylglucosamine diphosphatase [bacterium]|nr:UDP-2,3-diacylglucosamine diphosphatase [bacterium]